MERDLYPVTIVRTRYGGVYEGGLWAALDCEPRRVPEQAHGDDVECADFWGELRAGEVLIHDWVAVAESFDEETGKTDRSAERVLHVGLGSSPDEAYAALRAAAGR